MTDNSNMEKKQRSLTSRLIRYTGRVGTFFLLIVLVFNCATVPGLRDEAKASFIKVPFVRVLVNESEREYELNADGPFAIECLVSGEQSVYYSSKKITVRNEHGRLSVYYASGAEIERDVDEVNILPRGNNNRLSIEKKRYRGIIKLLPNGQIVRAINIVYMEDYLRGVVPPEIGRRKEIEIESVKAQAVAARTYAMAHLKQYPNAPYDLKSSIIDQVYEGLSVENKLVNKSIDATAGFVATYNDEFINAYYHSTCGGMTDDIDKVWDRKEAPYLKSVADGKACSWSKYYTWREVFTEEQLRGRIEQYLASDRGRDLRISKIKDIVIGQRSPGGRIAQMTIMTDKDSYKFKKDRIRWVIGRTSNPDLILPSDRFQVQIDRNGSGGIVRIAFEGSGYGHGVGMCQCGAIGMSREGSGFEEILKHYYTGIAVKKLY